MGSPPCQQPSIHHTDFKDKEKCVSFESVKGKEVITHRCTRKPLWALAKNQCGKAKRDELIEDLIKRSQCMSEGVVKRQALKLAEVSMCSQCGQNYQRVQEVSWMIADNLVSLDKPTPQPIRHAFTPQALTRQFNDPMPAPQSFGYRPPTPALTVAPILPPTPASSVTYGRRSPSSSPAPLNFSQENPFQRSQGRKASNRPIPASSTRPPHPILGDEMKIEGGFSNENVFQHSSSKVKGERTSPAPKPGADEDDFPRPTPPVSLLNHCSRAHVATKIHVLERQLHSKAKEIDRKDEEIAILRREKSDLGLQVKTLNRKIQTMSKVMADFFEWSRLFRPVGDGESSSGLRGRGE